MHCIEKGHLPQCTPRSKKQDQVWSTISPTMWMWQRVVYFMHKPYFGWHPAEEILDKSITSTGLCLARRWTFISKTKDNCNLMGNGGHLWSLLCYLGCLNLMLGKGCWFLRFNPGQLAYSQPTVDKSHDNIWGQQVADWSFVCILLENLYCLLSVYCTVHCQRIYTSYLNPCAGLLHQEQPNWCVTQPMVNQIILRSIVANRSLYRDWFQTEK